MSPCHKGSACHRVSCHKGVLHVTGEFLVTRGEVHVAGAFCHKCEMGMQAGSDE